MDDPFSVVQEMFSELNCVQWAPWESISAVIAVAGNGGETQEWERALCAMELVFLKILQIAHESCSFMERKKREKDSIHVEKKYRKKKVCVRLKNLHLEEGFYPRASWVGLSLQEKEA